MAYTIIMNNKRMSSDLLRGHTDTIILKLLLNGDRYGYEITKMVFERSNSQYELKEATMATSFRIGAMKHREVGASTIGSLLVVGNCTTSISRTGTTQKKF
jgi:hypothetical protein